MSTTKLNFVERVMEFMNGGDKAKISRFRKRYEKSNDGQINDRKREISEINDKLEDLAEESNDTQLSINLDLIQKSDGINSYIESYRTSQIAVIKKETQYKKEIERLEGEIEMFETLNNRV